MICCLVLECEQSMVNDICRGSISGLTLSLAVHVPGHTSTVNFLLSGKASVVLGQIGIESELISQLKISQCDMHALRPGN